MITHFALPFPVSVNSVWKAWHNRIVLCPKAREYRELVTRIAKTVGNGPYMVPVALHYLVFFPDQRDRDLANLDKVMTDGIVKAGLLVDDSRHYVKDSRFTDGGTDPDNPRVEVVIKPWEGVR